MDFSNLIPLVKESPINSSGKKCKLSNDESKRENHVLKEAHRLLKKTYSHVSTMQIFL